MRNSEIGLLETSQIELASEILGDAFKDNHLFQHLTYPDDRRRLSSIRSIGKMMLHYAYFHQAMLGVHPTYQNQGVGSNLIQPVLAEADRQNMQCYLETSTAAAVRFYQRHSFKVVETIDSSQGNIWAMKREPQF